MEPSVSLRSGERFIESFGTHWVKYLSSSIVFLLFLVSGITLFVMGGSSVSHSSFAQQLSFLTGLLILTFILHWFFRRLLSESMEEVIVTNKRFIFLETHLWSSDTTHEVTLERILAVEARKRGFFQNLLRYGSLWFDTGGTDTASSLIPLIPHPHAKAREILALLSSKSAGSGSMDS